MSCAVLPTPTIPVASFRFRKEFNCASKENNETVSGWYIRLKLLASSCQFGNEAEHFILNQFVIGLEYDIFERLCMEKGVFSLERSIELAGQLETAFEESGQRDQGIEDPMSCVTVVQALDSEDKNQDEQPSDLCANINASTLDPDTKTSAPQPKKKRSRPEKPKNPSKAESYSEDYLVDGDKYECTFCHRQWSHKGNLVRHIRLHLNEKRFTCHFCGNRFNTNSDLKNHLRTHTGERPFTCDFCDKSFTRSDKLKLHVDTHKGVKPHCCTICNKQFSQKSHLHIHMRIHTGERPFKCTICSKGFTTSTGLTGHMKFHQTARIETT